MTRNGIYFCDETLVWVRWSPGRGARSLSAIQVATKSKFAPGGRCFHEHVREHYLTGARELDMKEFQFLRLLLLAGVNFYYPTVLRDRLRSG